MYERLLRGHLKNISKRLLVAQGVLLCRHADCPVKTDHFRIEHRIFDDECGESRVFRRLTEPRRERHLPAQRCANLLAHGLQHRRVENAGRNGNDSDAESCEFAGNRQRHRNNAAFRCAIRGLPDLSVERSYGRSVDNYAALAARIRRVARHRRGRKSQRIERADQINVDDPAERLEPVWAVLSYDAFAWRDTGAIDQTMQAAESFECDINTVLNLC